MATTRTRASLLSSAPRNPAIPPAPCNICGGETFRPGPAGRLTGTGIAPACGKCGSLERHRAARAIFERIRTPAYRKWSCLVIGRDPSIAKGWFQACETVSLNGVNRVDIVNTGWEAGRHHVILCSHILEQVPDFEAALGELGRVTHPDGLMLLSMANPAQRARTEELRAPLPDRDGRYRVFGRDVEPKIAAAMPAHHVLRVLASDPCSGEGSMFYLTTPSDERFAEVFEKGVSARIVALRAR